MKRLIAILLGAVCILFCATDFGAAQSLELTGYRYTGKSEERTMDIWVSPGAAGQSADNRAIIQDCADRLPYYDKIQITWFESGSDFFSTLSKAVTAGNGPDVIVSSSEEWSTALIGRGYLLDLSTFFETCFSSGRLDDTRLCTDILDACRVRGELTVAPVRFSVRWVACTDAAADPLGLTREETNIAYIHFSNPFFQPFQPASLTNDIKNDVLLV